MSNSISGASKSRASKAPKNQGVLVLVVGPSGAGKDTLLDKARVDLARDSRFVFARRVVTRPAMAGAEDHDTLDLAAFEQTERAGGYLLSWRAHGLAYGLPASLRDELDAGQIVVANVSRGVVAQARETAARVVVLHVTASIPVLAARIAARGRESREDIEQRLARAPSLQAGGADVVEIRNEGPLHESAHVFTQALLRVAAVP